MKKLLPVALIMVIFLTPGLRAEKGEGSVVLMLNKSDDTVAFVDPGSLEILGTAPTGVGPHEVAVERTGRYAYVANYGRQSPGGSLSVIDVRARKEVEKIDLGSNCRPHGLAFSPSDQELWVTCEEDQLVIVVDPRERKVLRTIDTGQNVTHMIVLTPDGRKAFTANIGSDTVTVIDTKSGKVDQIEVGGGPEGIAITPDGKELWVAHRTDGDLSIISTRTNEILETVEAGNFPIRIKITPNGRFAMVSNAEGGDVAVFDTKSREIIKRIRIGEAPIGVLISPDGKQAFIASTGADKVSVVDLESWEVTGTVKPGKEPDGLGWASTGG